MSRLVFASEGFRVGIVIGVVRALMTLEKSKIGVVRRVIGSTESEWELIRTFPFSSDSASFRLCENQIVGVGSKSEGINQSQITFPRFVIGLVLALLLATPAIQFSLDRKRRSRKRINHNADYAKS